MRDPVEIILRGVPRSDALERYVDEQAQRLDRRCEFIQTCHVVVEALRRHGQQGAQFAVRLNITLPGTEVAVNREHRDDVYVALRDAFHAVGLQLTDCMRRLGNVVRRSGNGNPNPDS